MSYSKRLKKLFCSTPVKYISGKQLNFKSLNCYYGPFPGDQRMFASLQIIFTEKNPGVKVSESMYGIDHNKQT